MSDISFQVSADVRFGLDVVNRVGAIASSFGERALLVTEAILYEGKVIERIQGLLEKRGIQTIIFDEVVPNATSTVIDEGITLARGSHAQIVIGLGGIRTLSTAKCIAMVSPLEMEMEDFFSGAQPKENPLAFVEIPTTCRNPFMLTDEYLVTDARDRTARIGRTQKAITRAVLLDPKLTVTLPAKYMAATVMDALLSAVEGYLSSKSNELSEILFLRAIELIGSSIRSLFEQAENTPARVNASMAGFLDALGLTMSRPGAGTALAYALNARYMIPKSWLAGVFLPHMMDFFLNAASEKLARIAPLLGAEPGESSTTETAVAAGEAVRHLLGTLGLPTRLRDFDLNLDDMVEIAGIARSFDMINHLSRPVSSEDLYELIKAAY